MGYLRCETCGAKALSAASTCPRCAAEFDLHDARGQRVTLKSCSGCGIMHRKDRSCHWCGELKQSVLRSPSTWRSATGIAAVALVAVGSWAIREPAADVLEKAFAMATSGTRSVGPTSLPEAVVSSGSTTSTSSLAMLASSSVAPVDSFAAQALAADSATAPADSVQWEPAVARTWVNVRSDAGRGGEVVGIIKPSEKAMLGGVGRAGWRQVKSPEMSGWVDPRLFESDSLRTRG